MKTILYFGLTLLLFGCQKTDQKFESFKWKNNKSSRYLMVNSIIKSKVLIKKSKEEILQLLGKNTEIGPCNNCIGYSTNNPQQGIGIDHEVIQINFNKQGKVNEVFINAW